MTVSERKITHYGWQGVGYIVSDPQTGSGAYMISGGARGGELATEIANLLGIIGKGIEQVAKWPGKLLGYLGMAIDVVTSYINCGLKEAVVGTYIDALLSAGLFAMFYFKVALVLTGGALVVAALFIALAVSFVMSLIKSAQRECRIQ